MNFLWFSWKDITHPQAGGAEDVAHHILANLVANGHQVVLITSSYSGAEKEASLDGYKIIRIGNRWSVYLRAWRIYKNRFDNWPDVVIDECNTIPFFTRYYVTQKRIMVIHQLCREIWFYQMFWPLSWIGYIVEPLYLRLLRDEKVITISQSTCNDLVKYGFDSSNIQIMRLGISINHIDRIGKFSRFKNPTILSLGAIRPMKRTLDIVKAYEIAKKEIPHLKLIVAGDYSGAYGESVRNHITVSPHNKDIQFLGRVSSQKKKRLMRTSHLIVVTSVKEGWGLIVTEANSQGTPAIGYDVDGLRDSIHHNLTGLITKNNEPKSLSDDITTLLGNQNLLDQYAANGWKLSLENTYDNCYVDFVSIVKNIRAL